MFLFIIFLSFIAASKACLQGLYVRKSIRNTTDVILYNALVFTVVVIVFTVVFGFKIPSFTTLIYGLFFGLFSVFFQICYVKALGMGPVSLTVLLSNLHLIIPITVSAFLYGEIPTVIQMIGVFFLLLCFLMLIKKDDNKKVSIIWFLLSFTCFLCAGLSVAIQKIHQHTEFSHEYKEFIIFAYLFAAFLSYIIFIFINKKSKKSLLINSRLVFSTSSIALILGFYNTAVLYISGKIQSIILVPTLNGASTIFAALYSIFIFKDKLSRKQLWCIIFGIISIVLVSQR